MNLSDNWVIHPSKSKQAQLLHGLVVAALLLLVLKLNITLLFSGLSAVAIVLIAWYAWPRHTDYSYELSPSAEAERSVLNSTTRLVFGWRLVLVKQGAARVVFVHDDQLCEREQRQMHLFLHLQRLKRHRSM